MANISVLIAEDHHVVRKGISTLLSMEQDINLVGEAKDGKEAVQMAKHLCPDVVVMDITMPLLGGIDALRLMKRSIPETKILIFTMHTREQYIQHALKEGASGYLLKDATPEELIDAIITVHKGGVALSPSLSGFVVNTLVENGNVHEEVDRLESLTDRERQVLRLVAEGKSNKEIAECLSISKNTVNIHRTKMMQKLDIHDTIGLVKYCIEKGIIVIDK